MSLVIYPQEQVIQELVDGVVFALCHRAYAVYPRHRWLGCDAATDQMD